MLAEVFPLCKTFATFSYVMWRKERKIVRRKVLRCVKRMRMVQGDQRGRNAGEKRKWRWLGCMRVLMSSREEPGWCGSDGCGSEGVENTWGGWNSRMYGKPSGLSPSWWQFEQTILYSIVSSEATFSLSLSLNILDAWCRSGSGSDIHTRIHPIRVLPEFFRQNLNDLSHAR